MRMTRGRQPHLGNKDWEGLSEAVMLKEPEMYESTRQEASRHGCSGYNSPETQAGFIYGRNRKKPCVAGERKSDEQDADHVGS